MAASHSKDLKYNENPYAVTGNTLLLDVMTLRFSYVPSWLSSQVDGYKPGNWAVQQLDHLSLGLVKCIKVGGFVKYVKWKKARQNLWIL